MGQVCRRSPTAEAPACDIPAAASGILVETEPIGWWSAS